MSRFKDWLIKQAEIQTDGDFEQLLNEGANYET